MKIAIDISKMHKLSFNRGIGIYANNLFSALKKYTDLDVELVLEKPEYKKYNLVHFPFFDFFSNTLNSYLPIPAVVTVHDLIPIMFPKHYPPGLRGKFNWQLQRFALGKAKSLIAVSKTVKKDIENILKIDRNKISVVYSAPSENFIKISDKKILERIKEKYKLPDEFVLYIGNVNWNKNIVNMTEAVLQANKNLVIIGNSFLDKTNLNHPEKRSFKSWMESYSEDSRVKGLGSLPEQDVVAVMNLASCLIFVSYYEGFGLPILEAQACGTPVITGDTSSMPEIAGEGAVLVNPKVPPDIISGLKMLSEPKRKDELVKAGFDNLIRFSWKKTAIETMKVYQDAVK